MCTVKVGGVAVRLPRYYLDEMGWTLETERPVLEDFAETVGTGDVVWDVGAHCGVYSLLAAEHGADAIAIEAYPPNAARGRRYAAANGADVEYHVLALGDGAADEIRRGGRSDPIPTTTGDALAEAGVPTPSVLKVDVEGAEHAVLRGLEATLREHVDVAYVEVHNNLLEERGRSRTDVEALLQDAGFAVGVVADRELEHHQPILKAER